MYQTLQFKLAMHFRNGFLVFKMKRDSILLSTVKTGGGVYILANTVPLSNTRDFPDLSFSAMNQHRFSFEASDQCGKY